MADVLCSALPARIGSLADTANGSCTSLPIIKITAKHHSELPGGLRNAFHVGFEAASHDHVAACMHCPNQAWTQLEVAPSWGLGPDQQRPKE